ncbi:hypothetical protein Tco_0312142 [Tanacetum coccineum]
MAESSSQKTSSPEIIPKEEHVTLDKPESPNPFLPASQIIWEYLIPELNKKTKENIVPCLSVHNLTLKPNQPEEPPFTDHKKAICNLDVPVESKAPKPSSQTKEVPQVKNTRAKSGLRRKRSSKHTFESITEASKSQTGQSKKETKSSLAKDKSPSHPSPPTRVVGEMHKEAIKQLVSTSLRATSEEGAYPQLSSGMSAFIITGPVYSASFICTLSLHQDMMLQQIP